MIDFARACIYVCWNCLMLIFLFVHSLKNFWINTGHFYCKFVWKKDLACNIQKEWIYVSFVFVVQSASSLVVSLGKALNGIVSTFEWFRLVVTGSSLTWRPKSSLRCLLVEVPWQINEYGTVFRCSEGLQGTASYQASFFIIMHYLIGGAESFTCVGVLCWA